jgi:hypothetical protein
MHDAQAVSLTYKITYRNRGLSTQATDLSSMAI